MWNHWIRRVGFALLCLLLSKASWAGGPLKTNINGLAHRHTNPIVIHFEIGGLKPGQFDETQSRNMVRNALDIWTNVAGVNLGYVEDADLPSADPSNYQNFISQAGASIIFDETGEIIEDLFGECAQYTMLGVGGFKSISGESADPALTVIEKSYAIFNGACIEPVEPNANCGPCAQTVSQEKLEATILHEIGHMLGLGHAQVNLDSYLQCQGGVCPPELAEDIPTMFPIFPAGIDHAMKNLHRDDEESLRRLYGQPQENSCTVSGVVLGSDGATPLRGVEVVARKVFATGEFDTLEAIAAISGDTAPRLTASGKEQNNCIEDCGKYVITGLVPGESYQLCYQNILNKFTGPSFIGPVDPPFQGVGRACPEGLSVTCECPAGANCSTLSGRHLITSLNIEKVKNLVNSDSSAGSSGGCSVMQSGISEADWALLWIFPWGILLYLRIRSSEFKL